MIVLSIKYAFPSVVANFIWTLHNMLRKYFHDQENPCFPSRKKHVPNDHTQISDINGIDYFLITSSYFGLIVKNSLCFFNQKCYQNWILAVIVTNVVKVRCGTPLPSNTCTYIARRKKRKLIRKGTLIILFAVNLVGKFIVFRNFQIKFKTLSHSASLNFIY